VEESGRGPIYGTVSVRCPEKLRKITKTLSQDIRTPGRDLRTRDRPIAKRSIKNSITTFG